jgi:hypothetical protein
VLRPRKAKRCRAYAGNNTATSNAFGQLLAVPPADKKLGHFLCESSNSDFVVKHTVKGKRDGMLVPSILQERNIDAKVAWSKNIHAKIKIISKSFHVGMDDMIYSFKAVTAFLRASLCSEVIVSPGCDGNAATPSEYIVASSSNLSSPRTAMMPISVIVISRSRGREIDLELLMATER